MDFLLHNKPRKTKIKTSNSKIKFFQCRCGRQSMSMLMPIFRNGQGKTTINYLGSKIQVQKLSLNIILKLLAFK